MQWSRKVSTPPEVGAKRVVKRFAWFPTRLEQDSPDSESWVWLESYYSQQEYTHAGYGYDWATVARYAGELPF